MRPLFEQALALTRESGDTWLMSFAQRPALLNADEGGYEAALTLYAESLSCQVAVGDKTHIAHTLRVLEQMRHSQGPDAAVLPKSPAKKADQDGSVAVARLALGETAFRAARGEDRAMPQEEAIAYALANQS